MASGDQRLVGTGRERRWGSEGETKIANPKFKIESPRGRGNLVVGGADGRGWVRGKLLGGLLG
ncbi:MAG: hypothetical protein OHK0047_26850 [Leptolyngbyaceae cyanobacterium]